MNRPPEPKGTEPGYRSSDGDFFGKYCGDMYGCLGGEGAMRCKCSKCDPMYWWTVRRPTPRPDHPIVAHELKKLGLPLNTTYETWKEAYLTTYPPAPPSKNEHIHPLFR